MVGTSSAFVWAEGRGNFVKFTRASNGSIVSSSIVDNARTDPLIQTDFSVHHEIVIRERERLIFEVQVVNLLNQRAKVGYLEIMTGISSQLISPTRATQRFSGDPQIDWNKVMTPYNYVDALNATGAFAGVQSPITLASRYGLPQVFQGARNMRLGVHFTF